MADPDCATLELTDRSAKGSFYWPFPLCILFFLVNPISFWSFLSYPISFRPPFLSLSSLTFFCFFLSFYLSSFLSFFLSSSSPSFTLIFLPSFAHLFLLSFLIFDCPVLSCPVLSSPLLLQILFLVSMIQQDGYAPRSINPMIGPPATTLVSTLHFLYVLW